MQEFGPNDGLMSRSDRCLLSGKSEAELAKLGECPLDPGGYFVVKGTEKVILIQEQLAKNRLIIDEYAGDIKATIQSSTHERKTVTTVITKKGKLFIKISAFQEDINAAIVLRWSILSKLHFSFDPCSCQGYIPYANF